MQGPAQGTLCIKQLAQSDMLAAASQIYDGRVNMHLKAREHLLMRAPELMTVTETTSALHAGTSQTLDCCFGTCPHRLQLVRSSPEPLLHGKSPVNLAGSPAREQIFGEQIGSNQVAATK